MPKKKVQETPKEQAARFRKDAEKLIEAGELNPIEAGRALDALVRQGASRSKRKG